MTNTSPSAISHRLLPVATIGDERALELTVDGLVGGGLPVIEITLRTAFSWSALERAAGDDRILTGAGSVTSVAQAERAVDAGARFLVTPGFVPDVVTWAVAAGVDVFPGVGTVGEAIRARDLGAPIVKFFPAAASGGAPWLRAVAAPVPDVSFVPTGGVTAETAPEYLALPNVAAVGGSWFLPSPAADSDEIARAVSRALAAIS